MDPLLIGAVLLVSLLLVGGLTVRSWGGLQGDRRMIRPRPRLAAVNGASHGSPSLPTRQETGADLDLVEAEKKTDDSPPEHAVRPPAEVAVESPIRSDLLANDGLQERLATVEARLSSLERLVQHSAEAVRDELRLTRDSFGSAVASIEARQTTGFDRLRLDFAEGSTNRTALVPDAPHYARRAEAIATLYATVARLESSLAQVTNPILLPGEPYAPPDEFLPESLAWENWKDVGERAFSLADGFSALRFCFSEQIRQELGVFVTMLRGALTRSIYPNLVPDPTAEQTESLKAALNALSRELPRVRRTLEAEFQAMVEQAPTGNPSRISPVRDVGVPVSS